MALFRGSEPFHTLHSLWRHPSLTRADLVTFQNRKLRHLIAHAYANVAHYRDLFDHAGIKAASIRSVEDLRLIPLTSKDDLRKRPLEEVLAAGVTPGKLVALKTSGSSGRPFTVRRAPLEEHLLNMFRIRAHQQIGVRISDRTVSVIENPLGKRKRRLPGHLRQALGIYRQYRVDCFQSARDILLALERLRPDVITGYPSSLAYAGELLAETRVARITPRLIVTGGEVLSPNVRNHIQESFGARVFDFYGAHEFNLLAWGCPETGAYHVCDDNVIIEVLKNGKPAESGESGEVVATSLHSYVMPFIRYRTGDIAARGEQGCRCGQPFSTLTNVQGRAVAYLCLPGERFVHPYEITGRLIDRESNWVSQHQMIQESEDRVILRVVPTRPPRSEELERLRHLGEETLGPQVTFRIELVDTFPLGPGKGFHPYVPLTGRTPHQTTGRVASNTPDDCYSTEGAEFAAVPEVFLVHDPVAVGAFEAMERIKDPVVVERDFLFRDPPNTGLYAEQHRAFVSLLRRHAKKVIYLQELVGDHESFEAARTNPNQVFTRDALITVPWIPDGYITARMKRPLRRPESNTMATAAEKLGLREILRVPPHLFLEGGDVVPFSRNGRRSLLVGWGRRTGQETLYFLQQALLPHYADEIIGVELEGWRMNLDGGLLPVADDVVVSDTRSIRGGLLLDAKGKQKVDVLGMLRDEGMQVIDASPDESVFCQACNCVCLGERKVIYYDLSDRINGLLGQHDIEVHLIAGSELVKGRGGPRCMTRPIYRPL